MLTKQSPPTTKNDLITAIRQTQIDKVEVIDDVSATDTNSIKQDLNTFIRQSGSKPVSVVFLRARN